jgi:hypothetical protein
MKMRILISAALVAGCIACTGGTAALRFDQVVPGKSTQSEVRANLGEPVRNLWLRLEQRQAWGYPYRGDAEPRVFWIEWSPDGTVFSVSDDPDPERGKYRGP